MTTTVPLEQSDPKPSPVLDPSVSYEPGTSGAGEAQTPASSTEQSSSTASTTDEAPQSMLSQDVLTDILAAQGPLQPTAVDAQGVERIVGPSVDSNWSPAPVEPDPKMIEHLANVRRVEEERRANRLNATQAVPDNVADGVAVTKAALEAERSA